MARPHGSLNRRTIEGREFAQSIVSDPEYRAITRKRAFAGELAPAVEVELLRHAFGAPTNYVHVTASAEGEDLSQLTYDDLAALAERIAVDIRTMEVEDAQHDALVAIAEATIARRELEAAQGPFPDGNQLSDKQTPKNED